ncbi:MAG: hypothetical protein HC907_17815 [Richelia sp. SM1_7_0]|nr:hypothetical protein [Richelia sp. SM1_7_0]
MNNTVTIDLIGENSVNIGSDYSVRIRLCDAPDLTEFTGSCHIRANNLSTAVIIISPIVNVLTKDLFELKIPYTDFTELVVAGNYVYDVLFLKTSDTTDRFFPVGGKVAFIQRITRL